jgi:hypothetical protein
MWFIKGGTNLLKFSIFSTNQNVIGNMLLGLVDKCPKVRLICPTY